MNFNRLTVVTLGVSDLDRSTDFYEAVFGVRANRENEGVRFFELQGTWISLFPLDKLAEDISPNVPATRAPFSGVTLAHNARSREDVLSIFRLLESLGVNVVKPPAETFWGGFAGYFTDPDGFHWEVVWGPMFDFDADGTLRTKR